jgi:hypothetical protein
MPMSDVPKPRPHKVQTGEIPKRFRAKSRYVDLPHGLQPPDLTVDETAAYRRESRWTVHRKIREKVYESYRDGRIRKVVFASVVSDREAAIARSANPTGKRKPGGQFRKPPAEEPAPPATAPVEPAE